MAFIPVNTPALEGNEGKYLQECVDTAWISSEGPFVKRFEKEFAERVNRKFAISVTNGTVALEATMQALKVGEGDEVILPAFSIISVLGAVVKAGAKPVLVDCDPITWNMDLNQVEDKVNDRTKAIVAVHTYGLPVDIDPLVQLCHHKGIFLIEDAAESHGLNYKGRPCGGFGDISTFSFYPNKLITTGEGGMVLTDNPDLAERLGLIKNLFFTKDRFVHEEIGSNLRMTNLQAALGVAQLEQIDLFVKRKREIGGFYNRAFKELKQLQLPAQNTEHAENIYWVYGMVIKDQLMTAKEAMKMLGQEEIGTRPFFWPMHLQPICQKMGLFVGEQYPFSENIAKYGFYIPSGLGITDPELSRVGAIVNKIFS